MTYSLLLLIFVLVLISLPTVKVKSHSSNQLKSKKRSKLKEAISIPKCKDGGEIEIIIAQLMNYHQQ